METETNISLVKIDGKPIEKLIETISAAIGVLYNPTRIRKDAKAEADRNLILAKAKSTEMLIMDDVESELAKRAGQRMIHQELNRQKNIEDIADKVPKYMSETVSETPLDEDWRTRFFNRAQDISNEQLQEIWARILAEELKVPGKIGLKTLDILSNLSKVEAEYFNTACSISLNDGIILELKIDENGNRYYGMPYDQILSLMYAGLIHQRALVITYPTVSELGGTLLRFGKMSIICRKANTNRFKFDHLCLTNSGIELMNLLCCEKKRSHLEAIINMTNNAGFETEIIKSL